MTANQNTPLVVLVTGGAGFLGQHIVKHLHQCVNVKEIRVLDLIQFNRNLEYKETKPVRTVCADITNLSEEGRSFFKDVDCVFHCAAKVSHRYPPNELSLYSNNVIGTKNIVKKCIKYNIKYLIYTSGVEACLQPYFHNGYFSVIIHQTESKVSTPQHLSQLVYGCYGKSKLLGEKIVLEANHEVLANGTDILKTVSLRPTMLYGEGDNQFIPRVSRISRDTDGLIWSLLGPGGKQQVTYAGNAAWAHICAMETLLTNDSNIDGLPMFITDDTPIYDTARTAQTLTELKDINSNTQAEYGIKSPRKRFNLPAIISFIIALLIEFVITKLDKARLSISPKLCITYATSVIYLNRLRANLGINYEPLYSANEALMSSSKYYRTLREKECKNTF